MRRSPSYSTFVQSCREKFLDPQELVDRVAAFRQEGKSIATLNGSFDLMHAGHLEMLYQASLQADILLVALNTDRSIQEYKSPKRPFIPLEYRMQMMAAIQMVDFVTYFDQTDPRDILDVIRPDVHVNGAEYGEDCIEAQVVKKHGGRIHIVSLVPGLSTSNLCAKIVQVCS